MSVKAIKSDSATLSPQTSNLHPTSFSSRMGAHAVFTNHFLSLVSQDPIKGCVYGLKGSGEKEDGRKFGDYSTICETSKNGLVEKDRVNAKKIQMESNKTATIKEIREYEAITGRPFFSNKITHLIVKDIEVTDDEVILLIQRLPKLISLDLSRCCITDKSLEAIGTHLPKLQSINLSTCLHITDVGLNHIGKSCRSLRNLNIWFCNNITNDGLIAVIGKDSKLQDLHFGRTKINDEGLLAVGKGCPDLQVLYLPWLAISNTGLAHIGAGCPKLQTLYAQKTYVSEGGIESIAAGCPQLRELSIANTSTGNNGLGALGRSCQHLQILDCYGCRHITDDGLVHIGDGCPELQSLDVSNNGNVTNAGIRNLLKRCLRLDKIHFKDFERNREYFLSTAPIVRAAPQAPQKRPSVFRFVMEQPATHAAISALFANYMGFWPGVLLFAGMQGIYYAMRKWVKLG